MNGLLRDRMRTILAEHPEGMTAVQIADELGVSNLNKVSLNLRALESRAHVSRKPRGRRDEPAVWFGRRRP